MSSQHLAVLSQTAVVKDKMDDANPDDPAAAVEGPTTSKKLALEGRISCRAECKTSHTTSNDVYMRVRTVSLFPPLSWFLTKLQIIALVVS